MFENTESTKLLGVIVQVSTAPVVGSAEGMRHHHKRGVVRLVWARTSQTNVPWIVFGKSVELSADAGDCPTMLVVLYTCTLNMDFRLDSISLRQPGS